jgi:hypothetical protein
VHSAVAFFVHSRARMKRALLAVIAMSCSSTMDTGPGTDASPHPDGHGQGDGAIVIDAPLGGSPDAALPCKQSSALHTDGHHNPGQDCMGLCHFHGFAFAGTLMQADGHTPAVGATVTVVDANNASQDIVVGDNGNFYTFFPVAFPVRVTASLCPSVQVMTATAAKGGCNASDCHGGSQGLAHL